MKLLTLKEYVRKLEENNIPDIDNKSALYREKLSDVIRCQANGFNAKPVIEQIRELVENIYKLT